MKRVLVLLAALILAACGGASAPGPDPAFTPRVTYFGQVPPDPAFTPRVTYFEQVAPTPTRIPTPALAVPTRTALAPSAAPQRPTVTPTMTLVQAENYLLSLFVTPGADATRQAESGGTPVPDALQKTLTKYGPPEKQRDLPLDHDGEQFIIRYLSYSPENVTVIIAHRASESPPYDWGIVDYVRTDTMQSIRISVFVADMEQRAFRHRQ